MSSKFAPLPLHPMLRNLAKVEFDQSSLPSLGSSFLLATPRVSGFNPAEGIFVGFILCLYKIIVCVEKL